MEGSYSLLCYTRIPTTRDEANNEDIALSMHLALRSSISGAWTALNENYGIFFAAAVPRDGVPADARTACTAAAQLSTEPAAQSSVSSQPLSDALAYRAVMPGVDIEFKSLRDPYLFRLADGRFAIVATRTARGGAPDGSERSSFLLAVSRDLLSYTRLDQVHLDTTAGVHEPSVMFDTATQQYVIRWQNDDGQTCVAFTDDIVRSAEQGTVLSTVITTDDTAIDNDVTTVFASAGASTDAPTRDATIPSLGRIVPGNVITVSDAEASALIERFGRIYNTGVSLPAMTIPSTLVDGEARDLIGSLARTTAKLQYSDGSTAMRAVDWNADQLAALADDASAGRLKPSERRTIHGRIRQIVHPVPFAVERADPSVFAWNYNGEQLFLFIATDDTDGNCIDPNDGATHMPLRVASRIADLADANGGRDREIDLLKCGDLNSEGRAMTGCFWAPELHVIGGRLSVLFMPCFDGEPTNPDGTANNRAGKPDMWTGSCHIMQLKQTADGRDLDPRDPANWDAPAPILTPSGGPLNPVQRISLDMTVIQDSGRWYYAWQQVGSVWIASFDPAQPTRLTSEPRQIIVPEFAWDNMIAEGPNAVVHDGRIWLIYSGSLVGIDYTTGVVSAPAGRRADLTDPSTWTKLDYPLQKSGIYNDEWQLGTGHGMWSHDEDGNLIYVFHNAEYVNGRYGGRDAQVRRVHWSAEGMPILDMQTNEELNPAYAEVTMDITVR